MKKIDLVTIAKNLYFEVDEQGRQKFSLREIETKIRNETKKKVSYVTLSRWVKKLGWEKMFQDAKNLGLYKAVTEQEMEMKKEQISEHKIKQAKAEEQSKHYKALDHVFGMGYSELARRWKEEPDAFKFTKTGDLLDLMIKTLDRLKEYFGDEETKNKKIVVGIVERKE